VGKASSNKKGARAASTGGGRTAGRARPWGWYSVVMLLVGLGVFLVAFSRNENQAAAAQHPKGIDHWHAAVGWYICGTFAPNLPQPATLIGLHTHGDGLIHVEPYTTGSNLDTGSNATLARFVQGYPGLTLTKDKLQLPGGKLYKNGDKCGTSTANVTIRVWDTANGTANTVYVDPKLVHLKDQMAITVAFVPSSTDIPKPPSISGLANPTEGPQTTTTLPGATTVPGATSTTVAGGATTTAPGATVPPTTPAGAPSATTAPSSGGTTSTTK
jgi:hypothetical protein